VAKLLLSIDFEDWHQLVHRGLGRDDWDERGQALERQTAAIFELLDELSATATFFVLGMTAERYPDLVRAIGGKGHELACHGFAHRRVEGAGIVDEEDGHSSRERDVPQGFETARRDVHRAPVENDDADVGALARLVYLTRLRDLHVREDSDHQSTRGSRSTRKSPRNSGDNVRSVRRFSSRARPVSTGPTTEPMYVGLHGDVKYAITAPDAVVA